MKHPKYKILLGVCDFILIRFAISVALQVRGASMIHGGQWGLYVLSPEFYFFFAYALFVVLIYQYYDLYRLNVVLSRAAQMASLLFSTVFAVLGLAVLAFYIRSSWVLDSRLVVTYFGIFSFLLVAGYRLLIFRPLYLYLASKNLIRRNVALVGATVAAKNYAVQMEMRPVPGFRLVGFVDDGLSPDARVFEQYKNLGAIKDVPFLVERHAIDELVIASSDVSHEELLKTIDVCRKTRAEVTAVSSLLDVLRKTTATESYFDMPLIRVDQQGWSGRMPFSRRAFDFLASAFGLILLAPPLLLIALAIKLTSRGPVFYKQVRLGKDARPFSFYKFRTMRLGSESDAQRVKNMQQFIKNGKSNGNGSTKIVNENNVTPVGHFLRKTSLDELPQLFNVLKGDMCLVGPRPCLPYEYEAYEEWHKRRLSVTPGCTGLWQVSARSQTGFDDMVVLDLYYVDHQSPWLDLQILLKTIPVMLFGKGGK